ncbi:MAG: type III-B CRISPR module RAMP protein Cmr4 [Aigarchaeota archaeon]|nr:type III-B CRISPR module RAMP protein Cmr4 [Candidatus Pelearchaeum maunauluense]
MSTQHPVISPYEASEIVLLKSLTNLHPGVGRAGGIVDLPVQKDNLGFPIIYSSSLKGVLKSALWQFDRNAAITLFGPDLEDEEKFTSAVAILDAFTLVFPVRSLEGVYAYVTSPLLLNRFNELLNMIGIEYNYMQNLSKLSINYGECKASQKAESLLKIAAINKIVINEEIDLECKVDRSNDIEQLENLLGI